MTLAHVYVKAGIKAGLRRLGYTIQRLPSQAFDPQFALQVGFDYVLEHYVASRDDPRPFLFLQVGAYDGMHGDPIQRHVRKRGWHGILVEPQPSHFGRLVENYAGFDGLRFVNAAISDQAGRRTLYVVADEKGAPIQPLGDLATFSENRLAAALRKVGGRYPGSRVGSIDVECTTFADVLADVAYLDLLQIDVEGYDFELLKLFDFDRLTPPIVRFEHKLLSPRDLDDAVLLLARHGYRVLREENDMTAYSPSVPG